jgi:hypothetical protein
LFVSIPISSAPAPLTFVENQIAEVRIQFDMSKALKINAAPRFVSSVDITKAGVLNAVRRRAAWFKRRCGTSVSKSELIDSTKRQNGEKLQRRRSEVQAGTRNDWGYLSNDFTGR